MCYFNKKLITISLIIYCKENHSAPTHTLTPADDANLIYFAHFSIKETAPHYANNNQTFNIVSNTPFHGFFI